jgi:hypothetical protein
MVLQPGELGASVGFGIETVDPPAPETIGVIPATAGTGEVAEVAEVACGPYGEVVVVSRSGPGALLELPP